jgi:CRP/FNR family transcriptional regulator, nitrogen oxide reductase regulator
MIGAAVLPGAAPHQGLARVRSAARHERSAPPDAAVRTQPACSDLDRLTRCGLFRGLSDQALRDVRRPARTSAVTKGGICFLQGGPAEAVYVLVRGTIKLVKTDADGRQVIVQVIEPNDCFGYVGTFDGGTHQVSAEAAQDSRVLVWDVETVRRLMRTHPAIADNGLRLLAGRVEQDWDRVHDLVTARIEQRIARALLQMVRRQSESGGAESANTVGLLHQDLADLIGTNMYTVSRILCRWKRLGVIDALRGRVIIRSVPRLTRIAGESW